MNQKRQTMECRICSIVAIVSLPHIVMPPLLVLLNAAEHAYLLLCFIYCFALLLCFALFIALLIHCRSNRPTDSTAKASTWWWAFSSYLRLSLWGHGWIKMLENEDRVLQIWAWVFWGKEKVGPMGRYCAWSKCYSWQVGWTGLSLSRDGGAGQCASRHAIKINVWLSHEKREKGQSLVDIAAILNHILEIWPISHISCSLCSLGNILFRCKPKHQFQLPNIYFQLGRGLFVPKIHPNSLLSGLRGKPCISVSSFVSPSGGNGQWGSALKCAKSEILPKNDMWRGQMLCINKILTILRVKT